MDAGPWANHYAYAVKIQQQQNQFNNHHSNSVSNNNLNRNNGTIQQANCYNLNNFNHHQNQMYTQNMESLLAAAHYNNDAGFANSFNSHHNAYADAEQFISNQIQNAKASLSAAGLFKSKTKDSK